eukprot:evm.model.scf_1521.4 EVM.evm.TU.scf_1521.4   scf_1521:36050-38558(-)
MAACDMIFEMEVEGCGDESTRASSEMPSAPLRQAIRTLAAPQGVYESQVLRRVRELKADARGCGAAETLLRIAEGLNGPQYIASLARSPAGGQDRGCFDRLRHSFVVVVVSGWEANNEGGHSAPQGFHVATHKCRGFGGGGCGCSVGQGVGHPAPKCQGVRGGGRGGHSTGQGFRVATHRCQSFGGGGGGRSTSRGIDFATNECPRFGGGGECDSCSRGFDFTAQKCDKLGGGDDGCVNRLIVEPALRDAFAIGEQTPRYREVLALVPDEFVGPRGRLVELARIMCKEMEAAFVALGRAVPPWRRFRSVVSRWSHARELQKRTGGQSLGPVTVGPLAPACPWTTGLPALPVHNDGMYMRGMTNLHNGGMPIRGVSGFCVGRLSSARDVRGAAWAKDPKLRQDTRKVILARAGSAIRALG